METQNNDPTPRLMLANMDNGERAGEASPTGSAPSPTIDGDVAVDEVLADRRRRPPFEWTNERILDLIRFRQSMHAKHDELVKSMTAYQLKTSYHDGYEEVRNRYPTLWEVRLSVMFMKYADLLQLWTVRGFGAPTHTIHEADASFQSLGHLENNGQQCG